MINQENENNDIEKLKPKYQPSYNYNYLLYLFLAIYGNYLFYSHSNNKHSHRGGVIFQSPFSNLRVNNIVSSVGEVSKNPYSYLNYLISIQSPSPTLNPIISPSAYPTIYPTSYPSSFPTTYPSSFPTEIPTEEPTEAPTETPTETPTSIPTGCLLYTSPSPRDS